MDGDKFAVYQLKRVPEYRQIRFRPYRELQQNGIKVRCENYVQVYIGHMQPDETPETIRSRPGERRPRNFKGHSISTSDVLALNKEGIVMSYYVDGEGFAVIPGFIHNISPDTEISIGSAGCKVDGKNGSWHAVDSLIVDGQEFFLMEHDTYGTAGAYVILDRHGKLAVDGVCGFDQEAVRQIRNYRNQSQPAAETSGEEKMQPAAEISGEEKMQPAQGTSVKENTSSVPEQDREEKTGGRQTRSSVPGREQASGRGGRSGYGAAAVKKKKRTSVLAKLRQKQDEIARRRSESAP